MKESVLVILRSLIIIIDTGKDQNLHIGQGVPVQIDITIIMEEEGHGPLLQKGGRILITAFQSCYLGYFFKYYYYLAVQFNCYTLLFQFVNSYAYV